MASQATRAIFDGGLAITISNISAAYSTSDFRDELAVGHALRGSEATEAGTASGNLFAARQAGLLAPQASLQAVDGDTTNSPVSQSIFDAVRPHPASMPSISGSARLERVLSRFRRARGPAGLPGSCSMEFLRGSGP